MRRYPIGIQTFADIRNGGYVYVDKTEYVWRLRQEGKYYILSRPRRFGKSLLLSTLEAFYLGRRELFTGLAIADKPYDWAVHEVLHLDLNTKDYTSDDGALQRMLDSALSKWEKTYGLSPNIPDTDLRFADVIEAAYKKSGRQIVILIDEYDKPIVMNLFNPARFDLFRSTLKAFYGVLKSCDRYISLAFLTGVTKFGNVSVFSDLNNLRDISLSPAYNAICGITETELRDNFGKDIQCFSESNNLLGREGAEILRRNYDGYHFSVPLGEGIYNPFSLLNAFADLRLGDYWFKTGTPTLLVDLLKRNDTDLSILNSVERTEGELQRLDPAFKDPIPVIFQSGYLTIKDYDISRRRYRLGFPNEEVENGFFEALLPAYVSPFISESDADIYKLVSALESGNINRYIEIMQSFMADIPYSGESARIPERRFSDVIYIVSRLMGLNVRTEYSTGRGRIDLIVHTERYIYIIEFKVDSSPEVALAQIEEKGYCIPFLTDGRTIVKVGVEFSTRERNIVAWQIS
ncbi:MAG: ATP-binding protein [Muribaculaceae bacterium]|nr:ATP-binding protein [Muribaculaceae bacterium]